MAKKVTPKTFDPAALVKEMRTNGIEHEMPGTGRLVHLRSVDAEELLRQNKIPDILTPLVVKAVYGDLDDRDVRQFLSIPRTEIKDALAMADAINFICAESIADGTKVEDLLPGEKRWIFRLAMGPAELLITFRYEEDEPVGDMASGNNLS